MRFSVQFVVIVFCLIAIKAIGQEAQLMIPSAHNNTINTISFSADDRFFFSSSSDGTKIWKADDFRLLKNLPDYQPETILAHPSDSNSVFLVGFYDVKQFSLDRFEITRTIKNDSVKVRDAVMSPDGKFIYLCGIPKSRVLSMVVWRVELKSGQWEKIVEVADPNDIYVSTENLQINSKGTEILFNDRGEYAYLVDIAGKRLVKEFDATEVKIKTFTPNGNLLEIDDPSGQISFREIDRSTFSEIRKFTVPRTGSLFRYEKCFSWSRTNPNHILVVTEKDLVEVNIASGSLVRSSQAGGEKKTLLAENFRGTKVLVGAEKFIELPSLITLFEANSFRMLGQAGIPPFTLQDLASYPKSNQLGIVSRGGLVKTVELRDNGLNIIAEKSNRPSWQSVSRLAISPVGDIMSMASFSFKWIINTSTEPPFQNQNFYNDGYGQGSSQDVFYSPDGSLVATVGTQSYVMNVNDGSVLGDFENGDLGILASGDLGAISSDNQLIVFVGEKSTGSYSKKYLIQCYKIKTGEKLWENSYNVCQLKFRDNNKIISCVENDDTPRLLQINALTGEIVKSASLDIGAFNEITTTNKGDYYFLAGSETKTIKQFSYPSGELVHEFTGNSGITTTMQVLAGDEFLITGSLEGTIQLWDIKLKKLAARLFLFEDSDDWVILDPQGRFDASPNAMSRLYYTKGRDIIPLEAVYEAYFTPLLLARILNHQTLPAPGITDLKIRPTVKLNYAQKQRNLQVEDDVPSYTNTTGLAELTVFATAQEDKVDEIRLFHNGKIVNLATRGLFVTDEKGEETKTYTINLLPGVNSFRAVALNSQRTESAPDEIEVVYQTSNSTTVKSKQQIGALGPIADVDRNATLHLVVVGINTYSNSAMSLNYALADAQAFKEEIEKDATSLLKEVKTYFVTDAEANKAGIVAALDQVKSQAKVEDVFIFYYAGHGVIGKDQEFYLVPTDVSNLKNVQDELQVKGVPAKMMQSYAIDIRAQKQLFILDACQSAGAFEELITTEGDQQKSISVVSRSTGTHWIAASGAKQFANEFAQLGHGAFTYVLLEALKGEASTENLITVNGLKKYLEIQLPELMKKYSGTLQFPASYGYGNDFPVEAVKD